MIKIAMILIVIGFSIIFVPLAYSQIGSGLYEGFYIEYETTSYVESSDPALKAIFEQGAQELLEMFVITNNTRFEIIKMTNQGITFYIETVNQQGQIVSVTRTSTYSELSQPSLQLIVSTDSSMGDSIRIDFPDLPFLEFVDTRIIEVKGVPREMIVFAGETTMTMEGMFAIMGLIYTFDKETGFLTAVSLSMEMEALGETVDAEFGFRVKDMSLTKPIKPQVIPPIPPPPIPPPPPEPDYSAIYAVIGVIVVAVVVVGIVLSRRKKSPIQYSRVTQKSGTYQQQATKFCYNCQTPAPLHNKFCKKCGSPI